jgi:hypothetical protein
MKRYDRFKNIMKNSGLVIAKEANRNNTGKDPHEVALQAAINSGSEATIDNWRIVEYQPGKFWLEGNVVGDEKGRFKDGHPINTTQIHLVQTQNTAYRLGEQGYETRYEVLDPDGSSTGNIVWWPKDPGERVISLCEVFMGKGVTVARVPALLNGVEYDMLIDENGGPKGLPINKLASGFHAAYYAQTTAEPVKDLVGVAVLFRRKVL